MKKITILAISLIFIGLINYKYSLRSMNSSSSSSTQQKTEESFPGVKKISDTLYVGKAADEFYLAMERISPKNINMWLEYAKKQETAIRKMPRLDFLPTIQGVANFEWVLNDYKSGKIKPQNEIWIAYASSTPVTQMANLMASNNNPTIEMYLTVATSPKALITSHMGISRTWEAASDLEQTPPQRTKHPNQSMHLHSFAAKVMKLRDPKKLYMLTAPTAIMRDIIIKQMPPHSVFVGDNIYQEKLESIEKDPKILLDNDITLREKKETDLGEARVKMVVDGLYKQADIAKKISLLTTNPPRITRIEEGQNQEFIIPALDGKLIISFDQSDPTYQWLFTGAYTDKGIYVPYMLVDLDKLAKVTPLETVPEKEKASQSTSSPAQTPGAQPELSGKVSDQSLTMLYLCSAGIIELAIPMKYLVDSSGNPINLKELFEKYHIFVDQWTDKDWSIATTNFINNAKERSSNDLDTLPQLLTDAKYIIKSFLLTDDNELPSIERESIKKSGINRLFTYAKLQRVIEEKKLSHIRLPRKVLILQDLKTGRYVSSKDAPRIIDDILKVYISNPYNVNFYISYNHKDYNFIIFAHKESREGRGFSKTTMNELLILCKNAPFDIGNYNIFWDSKGDAVIIDTEYKGETSIICNKLGRYDVDYSL